MPSLSCRLSYHTNRRCNTSRNGVHFVARFKAQHSDAEMTWQEDEIIGYYRCSQGCRPGICAPDQPSFRHGQCVGGVSGLADGTPGHRPLVSHRTGRKNVCGLPGQQDDGVGDEGEVEPNEKSKDDDPNNPDTDVTPRQGAATACGSPCPTWNDRRRPHLSGGFAVFWGDRLSDSGGDVVMGVEGQTKIRQDACPHPPAVSTPCDARLDVTQFRVKAVTQPVAQQVHGENGEHDGKRGEKEQPPGRHYSEYAHQRPLIPRLEWVAVVRRPGNLVWIPG